MSDARDGTDDSGRRPEEEAPERDRRGRFERAVPDLLRRLIERAVESGVETLTEGPGELKKHLGDFRLPKEAAQYLFEQIDDTKKGVYRVVAKEIRDVLEHMSFADELAAVLTKLSFEISTQIRFVPNPLVKDAAEPDAAAEHADAPGAKDGAEDSKLGGESAEAGAEPRRKSRMPRPQVVSRVVMKARDFVAGTRAEPSEDEDT